MSAYGEDIEWTGELERFFKDAGECASGLSWLHKHAESKFSLARNYIELPVIVLGVLNGAASVGSSALFGDSKFASVAVGVVVLLTAILNTISSYFKWAARAEAHRISAIQFARLHRGIAIQLGLARDERLVPAALLREVRDMIDRLDEISPLLPPSSIAEFHRKFDGPEYADVAKPQVANGLDRIRVLSATRPRQLVVASAPASNSE